MEISREAYKNLLEWKRNKSRKPLIIRGARQVGKTTLIRQFSKEFSNYIELNLERDDHKQLFSTGDVNKIFNAALLKNNISSKKNNTLLFIDEIQELPKAIKLLRYFYEDLPELYVIAAGSLLEFALKDIKNFPVGRVEYLYLHPVNFIEFLNAKNELVAIEQINKVPMEDYAHNILLNLFHEYSVIGGMPEIVKEYIETKNVSLLTKIYNQLWQAYKDDVEKYSSSNKEKNVIRHVIESAAYEKDRIKFEGFGNSNYRSKEVGEALRALDLASIVMLIYPSTSLKPPIIPDYKKRPRLQFLDTGLLNQILMLQADMITIENLDNFHKGKIIQHLVNQELLSNYTNVKYKPNFWVREQKNSNSEVDIVIRYKNLIIPIEIKSGKKGRLKSLHQFIDETNHPFAVRIYAGKFSIEESVTPSKTPYFLMNLPYYLTTKLMDYIDFFVSSKSK